VGFFDVENPPPRRGRVPWPAEPFDLSRGGRLSSLDQLIAEIAKEYGMRNRTYIQWADENPESPSPPDVVPRPEDAGPDEV
jgi:hypothetical protein